jgi:uncharacterized membrane protein
MIQNPLYIVAFLCLLVAASEWLCLHTRLKHLSSSLLVIILGAVFANLGLIPSASNASPVYDGIFKYVAPLSIFFLLLGVSLKRLKKAGLPMLLMFFVGAAGTIAGVLIALQLVSVETIFGDSYNAIAGMMTGTYIGGSVNFNAVALHYDVVREGATYTGVVVVDNIITAIWMIVTLSIPKLMGRLRPNAEIRVKREEPLSNDQHDSERLDPLQLSILLGLGLGVLLVSDLISDWLTGLNISFPSILLLTTFALVMAQFKAIQQLCGAKLLGMYSVYLFLAVVGAFCEVTALVDVGEHAIGILVFTITIVVVHGLFMVLIGWFFQVDWALIAIASQANIGGGSTALALAKSFKRDDLLLPAILAGSIGSGVGTYFGFVVAGIL